MGHRKIENDLIKENFEHAIKNEINAEEKQNTEEEEWDML